MEPPDFAAAFSDFDQPHPGSSPPVPPSSGRSSGLRPTPLADDMTLPWYYRLMKSAMEWYAWICWKLFLFDLALLALMGILLMVANFWAEHNSLAARAMGFWSILIFVAMGAFFSLLGLLSQLLFAAIYLIFCDIGIQLRISNRRATQG
jgi:hypothetical protein